MVLRRLLSLLRLIRRRLLALLGLILLGLRRGRRCARLIGLSLLILWGRRGLSQSGNCAQHYSQRKHTKGLAIPLRASLQAQLFKVHRLLLSQLCGDSPERRGRRLFCAAKLSWSRCSYKGWQNSLPELSPSYATREYAKSFGRCSSYRASHYRSWGFRLAEEELLLGEEWDARRERVRHQLQFT